jgi:hypothetical protein
MVLVKVTEQLVVLMSPILAETKVFLADLDTTLKDINKFLAKQTDVHTTPHHVANSLKKLVETKMLCAVQDKPTKNQALFVTTAITTDLIAVSMCKKLVITKVLFA